MEQTVNIQGAEIFVKEVGQGTPMLMLHGSPDTGAMWEPLIERLKDNVRCIAVDLPGFGRSTMPANFSMSVDHFADVINSLLDYTKADSGHLRLENILVDPMAEAKVCMRLFEEQVAAKMLDIKIDPVTEDFMLMLDRSKLRQILLNLISNAIKFTPDHGKIALRAHLAEDRSCVINVQDNGIGMSDADVASALQPFAALKGKPEAAPTPLAKIGMRVHGLAPATTMRLVSVVNRLLPGDETPRPMRPGHAVEKPAKWFDSLTALTRRAARRYHQHDDATPDPAPDPAPSTRP